jgi:hypothetical protein
LFNTLSNFGNLDIVLILTLIPVLDKHGLGYVSDKEIAPRPLHQAQHQPKVPQGSRNSPARQRHRARHVANREKDAEEASENVSKETKQDKNLNETETASKEECEAVATKATVEEAKVDTDEESKSES